MENSEIRDIMDQVDLLAYFEKHKDNINWINSIMRFPEPLQREIIVERPDGSEKSIRELSTWILTDSHPKLVEMEILLRHPINIEQLAKTPKDTVDEINRLWNTNIPYGTVYDKNPGRYWECARKFTFETAKPSVLFNGRLYWGVGRFTSGLLRKDRFLRVWDIVDKTRP